MVYLSGISKADIIPNLSNLYHSVLGVTGLENQN